MKTETLERVDKLCAAYLKLDPETDIEEEMNRATLVITQIAEMVAVELAQQATLNETMKKFTTQPPLQNGFA